MRILHLATFLQGGAGRAITDLALHQRAAGHDVLVVTSRSEAPGFGNYTAYLQALRERGVPLLLVDSLFHREYATNLQALHQINRAIGSSTPDVIHAHAALPAVMGLLLAGARRDSIGLITTIHGWSDTKTPAQAEADVHALNLSHRVTAPSLHSVDLLQRIGVSSDRLHIVPYGVSEELPAFADRDRQCADLMSQARLEGRFVITCVGTVGERKRQRLIVEAIRHLPNPSAFLAVFIGDGDTEMLQRAAGSAGVAGSVLVHGYSPAARRLATEADALVLPSSREGQPLSILESFCDGNVVIASDIPELAELISDGDNGWLFAPDAALSLARVIERAMNASPADRERMTGRARHRYADAHRLADMTSRYFNHYLDVAFEERDAEPSLASTGVLNA